MHRRPPKPKVKRAAATGMGIFNIRERTSPDFAMYATSNVYVKNK
jgi:hypothetical protein